MTPTCGGGGGCRLARQATRRGRSHAGRSRSRLAYQGRSSALLCCTRPSVPICLQDSSQFRFSSRRVNVLSIMLSGARVSLISCVCVALPASRKSCRMLSVSLTRSLPLSVSRLWSHSRSLSVSQSRSNSVSHTLTLIYSCSRALCLSLCLSWSLSRFFVFFIGLPLTTLARSLFLSRTPRPAPSEPLFFSNFCPQHEQVVN